MYCKKCGEHIPEGASVCGNCGTSVNSNDNYYSNTYRSDNFNKPIDNPSHAAGVVSCCFPVVGLILYFLWKDEKPNSAKLICYWMLGGIALWVLCYVLFFIIGILGSF